MTSGRFSRRALSCGGTQHPLTRLAGSRGTSPVPKRPQVTFAEPAVESTLVHRMTPVAAGGAA